MLCCFPIPHVNSLPWEPCISREHARGLAQLARLSTVGLLSPFVVSSSSSPWSNPGESVWLAEATPPCPLLLFLHLLSWKKLSKSPSSICLGLPQHHLCTKRAKITTTLNCSRGENPYWPLSAHRRCHQPSLHRIKAQGSLETKLYWHKISRSNRWRWVTQRKFHLFSVIKC